MPIVTGPGTITMPNSLGSWTKKLDKNGDVAGFYTNLTDGPTTSQGTPTTSVVVASCWTDFGAELAVDGALATAEATCFGAPAWGDVTNQTYANRFLVCKARAT